MAPSRMLLLLLAVFATAAGHARAASSSAAGTPPPLRYRLHGRVVRSPQTDEKEFLASTRVLLDGGEHTVGAKPTNPPALHTARACGYCWAPGRPWVRGAPVSPRHGSNGH